MWIEIILLVFGFIIVGILWNIYESLRNIYQSLNRPSLPSPSFDDVVADEEKKDY